jgi:hypothetical protein
MLKVLRTICVAGLFVLLLSTASSATSIATFQWAGEDWATLTVDEAIAGDLTTLTYTLRNDGSFTHSIHLLNIPMVTGSDTVFAYDSGVPGMQLPSDGVMTFWFGVEGIIQDDFARFTSSGSLGAADALVGIVNDGASDAQSSIALLATIGGGDIKDQIPEPGTLLLLGFGLFGMGALRHRHLRRRRH